MTVQYLIDSENVGDFWIPLLDLPADQIQLIVFYTRNSPHMSYDSLIRLKESDRAVTFIKCYEGTNALDFQLVSELGYRISKDEDGKFVIVTNDTGFDAAVKYWRRRKKSVKRITGKECKNLDRRIREDLAPVRGSADGTGTGPADPSRKTGRQPAGVDHGDEHDAHVDAWHSENAGSSESAAGTGAGADQDVRSSRPNLRDAESASRPEPEEVFPAEEDLEMPDPEMEYYDPEGDDFAEEPGQEFDDGGEDAFEEAVFDDDVIDNDVIDNDAFDNDAFEEEKPEDETLSEEALAEDFAEETGGLTGEYADTDAEAPAEEADLTGQGAGMDTGAFEEEADLTAEDADTDGEAPVEETDLTAEDADTDGEAPTGETDLTGENPDMDAEAPAEEAGRTPADADMDAGVFADPDADAEEEAPESAGMAADAGPGPLADAASEDQASESIAESPADEADADWSAGEKTAADEAAAVSGSDGPDQSVPDEQEETDSDAEEAEEEPAPRSRSRRSRSRRSRSGSRKQDPAPAQEEASESPEKESGETADREKKVRGKKESADKKETDPHTGSGTFPGDEEIARIVACIGPDNLAELHNQLATFYGDQGKEIYLSIKNNSRRLPVLKPDLAQKFAYYCEIIFARSDAADEYPSDISEYLLNVREKLNNLNSLRYALQKHYGKEKGRRYYFLLKPFAKTMYQM